MINWPTALSVAFTGFSAVFIVLGLLSITVNLTSVLVKKVDSKKKNQMELQK